MSLDHSDITLADMKRLLDEFAASRAYMPRKEAEADYGEVLLYVIYLAAKSGVDVLAGASRELDDLARDEPRRVDRLS